MDDRKMNQQPLSARQLGVAVMVGGLSWAGVQAGRMDWRWALAALPVGILLGWLLLRRVNRQALFRGVGGGALAVLYGGWAVVLLACVLHRVAGRIVHTGGSESHTLWILLLLTLPLLWIGCGKAAAFFRLVEVFWLAVIAVLLALGIGMLPNVEWRYLLLAPGDWRASALAMAEVLGPGLFTLPHLHQVKPAPGDRRRGLAWLTALGLVGTALTVLVAGVLSPALAGQLADPFFAAAGVMGNTARLEGLISALWLLPDLTLAGLLTQSWGRRPRPAIAAALGCALALTGLPAFIPMEVLGGGTLLLAILTLLIPSTGEKIVVPFS